MLKNQFLSLIFFFFFINSSFSQKNRSIHIYLENNGNPDTLFLNKKIGRKTLPFDTIIINHGKNDIVRKYLFKEVSYLTINLKNKPGFLQIIFDNDLKVTGNVDSIWKSVIYGSKLTNEWVLYNKKIVQISKNGILKLHNIIIQLDYPNDSTKIKELRNQQNILANNIYINTKYYIKKNKSSFVSLFLLEAYYDKFGVFQSNILLKLFNKELQKNALGLYIKEEIEHDLQFSKGNIIPAFEVTDLVNESLTSKQLLGQVTLLDFWGTWCGPCRASLPKLKVAYSEYYNRGVKFLSIANEINTNPNVFKPLIEKENIEWKNYVQNMNDKSLNNLSMIFNVSNYPTYILVGRDGVILERSFGIDGLDLINKYLSTHYK